MSEKRHTLLITNDLGPHAGGIESFILGLIGEMDGKQIVIYTSTEAGCEEFDRELHSRYGVVVVRDKSRMLLPTPRVNRAVAKVLERYESEYVWFGAAAPLGLMAGLLRKRGAKRIVALTHGHEVWWAKVPLFSLALRLMARNIDVITYLGEFTKNAMRPAFGSKVRMERVAPGIDTSHFSPGERDQKLLHQYGLSNKKVIVCVGRLVRRKGQDRLVEAMPGILAQHHDAHLLVVGRGGYVKHLQKRVKKLGISEHVTFVGRIKFDELPLYIRLGDIFAMPSRSRYAGLEVEGLGIVYLEASSCGIPVVAGASGGAPDAVLQGETGVVVNGNNVAEIAREISSLLANDAQRESMAKRGREWAVAEWGWKVWGKRFSDLLYSNN